MKYNEVYKFLCQITPLPANQWEFLESLITEKKIKKNEFILKSGDIADSFILVLSGSFRMYYIDSKGSEFTKNFVSQFEIASPYAEMLQSIPSRVFIQALEDSHVIIFKYDQLINLYQRDPAWNTLGRIYAEKYFVVKEKREYELLLLSAKERYDIFCQEYPHLISKIPQYQIASFLGITPVSLSRLLKDNKIK